MMIKGLFAGVFGAGIVLAACSSQVGPIEHHERAAAALTPAETRLANVLGFEDAALWRSGTARLSRSNIRVEGRFSLAVQRGGFHTVESVRLGPFDVISRNVVVSFRLPTEQANPNWFGDVQLFVSAPSVGVFNAFVGHVNLVLPPTGLFTELRFTLPEPVFRALQGTFDDLVIRIALNVPRNAPGTYRFDHLRFGGVSACALSCNGVCVSDGSCIPACADDLGECDGDIADGCETDLLENSRDCGACNNVCGPGFACEDGACLELCEPNEMDCDGNTSNDCETDVLSNPENCGDCGVVCASGVCDQGACVGGCLPEEGDCDGNATNGCETPLGFDSQNCGACDNVCTPGSICEDGACLELCDANTADCDRNANNGCETDVSSSASHCGACGLSCGARPCVNGVCSR